MTQRTYEVAAKEVAEKVAQYCYTGTDANDILSQIQDGDGFINPDERKYLQEFPDEDPNALLECLAEQIVLVRKSGMTGAS